MPNHDNTLIDIALRVVNSCVSHKAPAPEDVQALRRAAPSGKRESEDISLACHILDQELSKEKRGAVLD
jgi:hypothetical protein